MFIGIVAGSSPAAPAIFNIVPTRATECHNVAFANPHILRDAGQKWGADFVRARVMN